MGLRTPVDGAFSSRGPRTIQIIENVDIIQIFASVHLLLRVDHPRYLSALRKVMSNHVLTPCQKFTQPPHQRLKRRASTNTSHRNVSPWTSRLWWTVRREEKAGPSDLAGKCWMMTIAPAIMILIACSSGSHVWISATPGRIASAEMNSMPSVLKRLCAWRKLKMWLSTWRSAIGEEHLSRRLQCSQNGEHAKQFLDILQQGTPWLRRMVIARCRQTWWCLLQRHAWARKWMGHKEQVSIGVHGKNVYTHGQSRDKSNNAAIGRVFLQIFGNVLNQHFNTHGDWKSYVCGTPFESWGGQQ